jgi:hypothetical protein
MYFDLAYIMRVKQQTLNHYTRYRVLTMYIAENNLAELGKTFG